jgi:hypothetical protein
MNTTKISEFLEKVSFMDCSLSNSHEAPTEFANAGLIIPSGPGVLISVRIDDDDERNCLDFWVPDSSEQVVYIAIYFKQKIIPVAIASDLNREESLVKLIEEHYLETINEIWQVDQSLRVADMDDDDRIDCPFCGKTHYPGAKTVEIEGWSWCDDTVCEHLLFLAVDLTSYSGFQYRSKLLLHHLNVPDTEDGQSLVASERNPGEFLPVYEVIELITLKGLELRGYDVIGGVGGDVIFGFVPVTALLPSTGE